VRRIVAHDDYGFEEFVGGTPEVETREEVERFFRRIGMTLALLEALEGRDFHSDNVLATGEHLALLDLEALFAPRPRGHPDSSGGEAAAIASFRESPLLVGLLPDWAVGEPGRAGIPSGALQPGGRRTTPHKVPVLREPDGEEPYLASDYSVFEEPPTVPLLEGRATIGPEYLDATLDGYREMTRLLMEHAASLAGPGGWLERAGTLPVRFIPRFTRFYDHFRFESLAPDLLTDGRERDLFLDRLFRACSDGADPMVHLVEREVSEIRDLRGGARRRGTGAPKHPHIFFRPDCDRRPWLRTRSADPCRRWAAGRSRARRLRDLPPVGNSTPP
jgi:lantibiotic modifying enzyme